MRIPLNAVRFYGILDTGYVAESAMPGMCRALIAGGAGILQLRAKKNSPFERIRLLDTLYPICREAHVPLVVNDCLELALRHPDVGLHVGQDDLPVPIARERLGPGRILGLSTHSRRQALEAISLASHLDYFAVGPVFATATKPDYAPVGLELVNFVSRAVAPLPWFCIGGINRTNAAKVARAGGQRVVVVSDVLQAEDPAQAVRDVAAQLA